MNIFQNTTILNKFWQVFYKAHLISNIKILQEVYKTDIIKFGPTQVQIALVARKHFKFSASPALGDNLLPSMSAFIGSTPFSTSPRLRLE